MIQGLPVSDPSFLAAPRPAFSGPSGHTPCPRQLLQVPSYCPSPRLHYLRLGPFPPSSREIRSPPEPCPSGHLQHGLPSHMLQFLSTFYLMLRFSGTNLISSTRLSAPGVRVHVEFIFISSAVPGTVSHSGGYLILIE